MSASTCSGPPDLLSKLLEEEVEVEGETLERLELTKFEERVDKEIEVGEVKDVVVEVEVEAEGVMVDRGGFAQCSFLGMKQLVVGWILTHAGLC